jgi:hypothetical protein
LVKGWSISRRYDRHVPDRRNLAAFNATQPHIARVYGYLLGGKDNFAADRAVGDRLIASMPWDQPIGLPLCGILHYILDEEKPVELVEALYRALPAGSYVLIHHMLDGEDPHSVMLQTEMQKGLGRSRFRTFAEIGELFARLEMVEPGLVLVPDWRPDPDTPDVAHHPVLKLAAAGVARKTGTSLATSTTVRSA